MNIVMPNPILASLALTAGTTWVTQTFQNRAAKIAAEQAQRQSELEMAKTIYTEVSTTLDTLRFYMVDEAIYAARRKAKRRIVVADAKEKDAAAVALQAEIEQQDNANWAAYNKALAAWKTSQNRLVAQTEVYFGKAVAGLLVRIGEILNEAERQMEATYYGTSNSLIKPNKSGTGIIDNSKKFFGTVEPLTNNLRELNRVMMVLRRKQKVGSLRN